MKVLAMRYVPAAPAGLLSHISWCWRFLLCAAAGPTVRRRPMCASHRTLTPWMWPTRSASSKAAAAEAARAAAAAAPLAAAAAADLSADRSNGSSAPTAAAVARRLWWLGAAAAADGVCGTLVCLGVPAAQAECFGAEHSSMDMQLYLLQAASCKAPSVTGCFYRAGSRRRLRPAMCVVGLARGMQGGWYVLTALGGRPACFRPVSSSHNGDVTRSQKSGPQMLLPKTLSNLLNQSLHPETI